MDHEQKAIGKSPPSAYVELRRLLLPEGDELSRFQGRVSDPQRRAEDVSEVLPRALRIGAACSSELRSALRPLIEDALWVSVQKDPAILAEVLFTIFGAALRRAIFAPLRSLARNVNGIVEQNLSWRGWTWHWESLITGDPFGGIVLARSLLFRVEQVFLIHRETGLLLVERGAASGMLTKVQAFVRDSSDAPPAEGLETLSGGDLDVWIQHGPQAVLAAVIRGTPPKQLKSLIQHTLEQIHENKGSELEAFGRDPSPFLACQEELQACLVGEAPRERGRLSRLWWLAAAILLEAIAYWTFTGVREHRRWDDYLARLNAQPGIVVTSVDKHGSSYAVAGLRDPLALDPATLLPGTGVDPKNVAFRWEPYHSLQPSLEAARRLTNEKLIIENQTLHFGPGSSDISEEHIAALDQMAAHLRTLLVTGKNLKRRTVIDVIGHTDGTPVEAQHNQLAQTRAETVRNALIDAGVPQSALVAREAGASQPLRPGTSDTDKLFNRYVSFRVN